jgi:hypothetical protein
MMFVIYLFILSLYRKYYNRYQTIKISDTEMLEVLNEYDFTKYCINESTFNCGSLATCFNKYIVKSNIFPNDINMFIPFKKSYFHDTEYNMYGYITYHDEYLSEKYIEVINVNFYDVNREITLQLDTTKSRYTFKQYYDILAKNQQYHDGRLFSFIGNRVISSIFNPQVPQNIIGKYKDAYFPGNVHISIGGANYLRNLASETKRSICLLDLNAIKANLRNPTFGVERETIFAINYSKDLLQYDSFYEILNFAKYAEDCIFVIFVENYNDIKGTKVMDYITNYVIYK